jgi:hypothetical protein
MTFFASYPCSGHILLIKGLEYKFPGWKKTLRLKISHLTPGSESHDSTLDYDQLQETSVFVSQCTFYNHEMKLILLQLNGMEEKRTLEHKKHW